MYSTGANRSLYDIRTFSYIPTKANIKGGLRYEPEDIEHQHSVGICTAIHLTQNARKALGLKFSAEFQYLLQKKYLDKNWDEGSSIFNALKVGTTYGFLPADKWTVTTEQDRLLPYNKYIKKLQAVSDKDIEKLLEISKNYKLTGYAKVPTSRDDMANAIDEAVAGILVRFEVDSKWWTAPIEPLRPPLQAISGHAIIESNYNGNSFRVANTWGKDWADKGTAYHTTNYLPTEAWIPYYDPLPDPIEKQKQNRATIIGQIMDLLQKIIALLPLLV